MDFPRLARQSGRLFASRAWRFCFGVALALALCLRLHVAQRMENASFAFDLKLTVLGVGTTFVIIALRAWRWNVIIGDMGRRLPLPELAVVYGSTFFLGLISPGRVGEAARVWLIRDRVPGLPSAAFSVAFDRICDIAPTLLITACFAPLFGFGGNRLIGNGIRFSALAVAVGLGALLFDPRWLRAGVNWTASRLLSRAGQAGLRPGDEKPAVSICPSALAKVLLLSLLSQAALVIQTYLFARAVAMDINPLVTYAVVTMATVVASLPLSIGGIGTREIAVVWALTSLGFSTQRAVAFSLVCLLNFIVTLVLSMIVFINRPLSMPLAQSDLLPQNRDAAA
jgi:hypothetical protein